VKTHLRDPRLWLIVALLITSVPAVARFDQSLWSDEATSVWLARQPIDHLLRTLCDPHPAGYYVLLKLWLAGGEGEAWLRIPSLLTALAGVVITYRLGTLWANERIAGMAALLLALQPAYAWYASEVRMYAPVTALGVLAVWLGDRALRSATAIRYLAYAAAAGLALWIDYSAVLPLGLLQLIWLARGAPHARRWLAAQAVVAAITMVTLTPTQLFALRDNIYPVFLAIQATNVGVPLTPAMAESLIQAATLIAAALAVMVTVMWRTQQLAARPATRLIFAALWVIGLIVAALPQAFTVKRRILLLLPFVALAAAQLLAGRPRGQAALIGLSGLATLASLWTLQREPWRDVMAEVAAAQPPAIWVDVMSVPAFDYYWRRLDPSQQSSRWAPLDGRVLPMTPPVEPPIGKDLWLIAAESPYRNLIIFLPIAFRQEYELIADRHERGIGVYVYRRRATPDVTAPQPPAPTSADEWGLQLLSPLDSCTP
jgi:hypothetical protein